MPRQLRAMGKRKPSLDMRYLLIMMRAEETAIQPRQAPAVIACTGQPLQAPLADRETAIQPRQAASPFRHRSLTGRQPSSPGRRPRSSPAPGSPSGTACCPGQCPCQCPCQCYFQRHRMSLQLPACPAVATEVAGNLRVLLRCLYILLELLTGSTEHRKAREIHVRACWCTVSGWCLTKRLRSSSRDPTFAQDAVIHAMHLVCEAIKHDTGDLSISCIAGTYCIHP